MEQDCVGQRGDAQRAWELEHEKHALGGTMHQCVGSSSSGTTGAVKRVARRKRSSSSIVVMILWFDVWKY